MASQKYSELLEKMRDLHIRKSASYALIAICLWDEAEDVDAQMEARKGYT